MMFSPNTFAMTSLDQQRQLVDDYPFATVIQTTGGEGKTTLEAQHLPLYWHGDGDKSHYLYGHVAKGNPLFKNATGRDVLCVFQGPQAYITPNWYPTKQQHGKAVPTWNYVAVHIHGQLTLLETPEKKLDLIERLTQKMEAKIHDDPQHRWQVSDAPKAYIEKLLNGIVGLEISIQSTEGQCKLSQNQEAINIQGVIKGLEQSSQPFAKAMAGMIKGN